jgi:hypothetical protein
VTLSTTALRALKRKQREGFVELAAAIASLEAEIRKSKAKAIPKPEAPGLTKEQRKEERNKRAAEIRAEVMKRADGRCEFCHREGFVLEWHHIFGAGDRTHKESSENTAAICADCHHRGWAKNEPQTFRDAKAWAILNFFGDALREIEHRMALSEAAPTKHRRVG